MRNLIEERYYDSVDNINNNNYYDRQLFIKRIIMKLNTKQKRSVKRRVEIEQGISSARHIVFKSKKIYTRKSKHKNNTI